MNRLIIALGLTLSLGAAGQTTSRAVDSGTELTEVEGLVVVAAYDEEGEPVSLAIEDRHLGTVLVEHSNRAVQLLDLIDRRIQATGVLKEIDDEYEYSIALTCYRLLDPDESEWYDHGATGTATDGAVATTH